MSNAVEDSFGVNGLLHCPQCRKECVDARALFRHVEAVFAGLQSTCLERMGLQMEEFRADYRNRRRKVAYRKKVMPEVNNRFSRSIIVVRYMSNHHRLELAIFSGTIGTV